MAIFRVLSKWLLISLTVVLALVAIGLGINSVGLDGWQKAGEAWAKVGVAFVVLKYAIVVTVIYNWYPLCLWYGRLRDNEEFGQVLAKKWHVFAVMFIVIEVFGFFS